MSYIIGRSDADGGRGAGVGLDGSVLAPVVPQVLFRASFDRQSLDFGSAYSPAPDGQRFMVVENLHNEPPTLTVTINWTVGSR